MKKKIISAFAALLALSMIGGCSDNGGSLVSDSGGTVNGGSANSTGNSESSNKSSTEGSDQSSTESSDKSSTKSSNKSSTESSDKSSTESSGESGGQAKPVEVSNSAAKDIPEKVEITADNMLTSIKLFDVISEGKENAMFSPLSLNMALGLIDAGAAGSTKTALDTYLGSEDYSGFASDYLKKVESQYNYKSDYDDGWKNVFEIANSFWANKNLLFKEEYKNNITASFGAEAQNLDFSDRKKTLETINGWVSEKTHKMIPSILEDYDPDTIAAVLINTIYFESAWREKWSIHEDVKQTFTLSDGSTKEIPLMRSIGDKYFENDKATAFSSRYINGLDFIGILPKQTGDFSLEELDIRSLLESASYDYDVTAQMPKLEFETEIPLTDTLKAFGLSEIFDEDAADFSGMSDVPLFVSQILQKTKLELDENGTKAAAVTMIVVDECDSIPVEHEKKEVTLDRPFAFLIYDSAEDQIVFLGKVTDP